MTIAEQLALEVREVTREFRRQFNERFAQR
jgi:hypothetical protein